MKSVLRKIAGVALFAALALSVIGCEQTAVGILFQMVKESIFSLTMSVTRNKTKLYHFKKFCPKI